MEGALGGRRRWKHPKWPFDWWCSTGAHLVSVGAMEPEVLGAPSGGAKTHSQGEGAHRHKRDGAPPNEGETQVPKEPTRRYHCEKDDGAEEHGAAEVMRIGGADQDAVKD